jgi:hypothetical protein
MKELFLLLALFMFSAGCDSKDAKRSITNDVTGGDDNDVIKKAEKGDTIKFGNVEWIVLEKEGSRVLIITKYIVAIRSYNDSTKNITTWKDCDLREYFNGKFLKERFNATEISRIVDSNLDNPNNPTYHTAGGDNTVDKIFPFYKKQDIRNKAHLLTAITAANWYVKLPYLCCFKCCYETQTLFVNQLCLQCGLLFHSYCQ